MHGAFGAKAAAARSFGRTRLLRAAFAASSALAPELAARAGERLFCWPPRRLPSRHQQDALAAGEALVVTVDSERVRAWRFGAGPTVLLVHGWGGHAGQLGPLVSPLTASGYSVVAFDAPAHGGSTGRFASGIVFARAISSLATRFEARAAVGHSIGAAALGWAILHGLDVEAAVMLAPPCSVGPHFRRFCDAVAIPAPVADRIRQRIRRRYGVTPEEFDLGARASEAKTPLLVIHDRDDRSVPWTDGQAVARAWPGARLVLTDGLGHTGVLRDEAVVKSVTWFVREHVANEERPAGQSTRPIAHEGHSIR